MTEWNAPEYARISVLQAAMAAEALALLELKGTERILDVGCGNGKITAEIAARVPQGSVTGVDASSAMIGFAAAHYEDDAHSNLRFAVADARHLPFAHEFDLVVSFNALHWIPEQAQALHSIRAALKPGGLAQLRLVPKGARKSLEDVVEESRSSQRWSGYFEDFADPYLHLTPEQYEIAAERQGFRVVRTRTTDKSWDFHSRSAFHAFSAVGCTAWTQHLPEAERPIFITDVLERYGHIIEKAGQANIFEFYQMDITLSGGEPRVTATKDDLLAE